MFEFFARLFRGEPSGAKAKERLRLVLLSDHLALAPDIVESLKTDLLDVISRYVEVDTEHVDVTFEQREHEVAMLANVPILSVKNGRSEAPVLEPEIPPHVADKVEESPKAETQAAERVDALLSETDGMNGLGSTQTAAMSRSRKQRRRRRRRKTEEPLASPSVPPSTTEPPPSLASS
ncbi:MAG: cell division topological specificity factor MinE [Candidatus Eremiobacteraeota bacterium]|nr:cell division topological specificity factor MinE [Candidatus Eremiobacteraeota bacterium]MBV9645969.1 cell division topological specificity factor MinE [Candidatus Eremiobacteraeota bacterium]